MGNWQCITSSLLLDELSVLILGFGKSTEADDAVSKNKVDNGKSREGRYIGGVRDTSAPTDISVHVLNFTILFFQL